MIATPNRSRPESGLTQRRYFDQMKDTLIERLITDARSEQGRAALARDTGIDDEKLLTELADLGFAKHTLVTLRLVPLVMVAWAEKHVEARERSVIFKAARKLGIHRDTDAYVVLDHWLNHKPPRILIDAWKRYICGLMQGFGVPQRRRLIDNVKTQMLAVANASGGLFGLHRVSAREREAIDGLIRLLESCSAAA